jgi:uncharacterized OB-fold protein
MALKYEDAREFVRKCGNVTAYTTSGMATALRDGEPDVVAVVELYADVFEFNGKKYSRPEFERLVHNRP